MRITLEQPSNFYKNHKISILVILSSWIHFTTIFNIYLKSKLFSSLVPSSKSEATLEQILQNGSRLVLDSGISDDYLNKFLIIKSSLCETLRHIENNNAVLVGEKVLMFHAKTICLEKTLGYISSKRFLKTAFAWPFRSGVPFVGAFNKRIRQLIRGCFSFWFIFFTGVFF